MVFKSISKATTVLLLKIIYQQLWEKNIDWDQTAPDEIQQSRKAIMKGIINFKQLKIPRWIGYDSETI